MSAGEAGRHVVGFLIFFIDVFLEVQNQRYSLILYLIDYIAYGLHLWYKICIFKEICRKPISLHPGLATSLHMGSSIPGGLNYRKQPYKIGCRRLTRQTLHSGPGGSPMVYEGHRPCSVPAGGGRGE